MPEDQKPAPKGLITDRALIDTPPGALSVAEEVILRTPGVLEPRPGFSSADAPGTNSGTQVVANAAPVAWDGEVVWFGRTGLYAWFEDGDEIVDEDGVTIPLAEPKGLVFRDNLYLCAQNAPRKAIAAEATGDTPSVTTGAPAPAIYYSGSTSGSAVPNTKAVKYRALVKIVDDNGVITRSAPSNPALVDNVGGGGDIDPEITVYLHKEDGRVGSTTETLPIKRYIELYRTVGYDAAESVEEEYYLAREYQFTTSESEIVLDDGVLQKDLGQALYTNALQQGATATHIEPPEAGVIAEFQGSLILGDLRFRPQVTVQAVITSALSDTDLGESLDSFSLTTGSDTGTVTDGSVRTIGEIIENSSGDWNTSPGEYVRIIGIAGNTITFSHTWGGTTAAHPLGVSDAIHLQHASEGSYYLPLDELPNVHIPAAIRGHNVDAKYLPSGESPPACNFATADAEVVADALSYPRRIVIRFHGLAPGILGGPAGLDTSFSISATRPLQYSPQLPTFDSGTPLAVNYEEFPGSVMVSDYGEPEHFRGFNLYQIGNGAEIHAITPAYNGLVIYASDGAYFFSGAGADSGFRWDPIDETVRIVNKHCAASMRGTSYAWTFNGVVAIGQEGVTDISRGLIGDRLRPVEEGIVSELEDGVVADVASLWTNPKASEVCLAAPLSPGGTVSNGVLVYNTQTRSWVEWFPDRAVGGGGVDEEGLLHLHETGNILTERVPNPSWSGSLFDATSTVNITVINTATSPHRVTTDAAVSVGDVLDSVAVVTADLGSNVYEVHDASGLSTGSTSVRGAVVSRVRFRGLSAYQIGALKQWGEGVVWWGSLDGLLAYQVGAVSDLDTTLVEYLALSETPAISQTTPQTRRFVIPRNHSFCTRLEVELKIYSTIAAWRLEGLQVSYTLASTRVRSG